DPRLARFSERQFVDLSAFPRDHVEALSWQGQEHRIGFNPMALAKIKERLFALGLSPGSFRWPPRGRSDAEPYPGLAALDEGDAGIFFGRDADIAEHSAESDRLLGMLAAFLAAPSEGVDPYVLLTIRADSVQALLDRVAALGLETPKPLYLPPMSPAAYREVILRPAEVYSARVKHLAVEPQLVDALARDAT